MQFSPTKIRICAVIFLCCGMLGTVGCQRYQFYPYPPGTIHEQRVRATIHDPWPDNDAAPVIEGGRPREFEKPLAEPKRVPLYRDTYGVQR